MASGSTQKVRPRTRGGSCECDSSRSSAGGSSVLSVVLRNARA